MSLSIYRSPATAGPVKWKYFPEPAAVPAICRISYSAGMERPPRCPGCRLRPGGDSRSRVGCVLRLTPRDSLGPDLFGEPDRMSAFACVGGACHALAFTYSCIQPVEYLRPRLGQYPREVTFFIALLCASAASIAGCVLVFSGIRSWWVDVARK